MQKAVWNGLGEGSSADPFILEVDNDFDINNSFNIKIESNFMGWQNEENYFRFSNSTTVYLLALIIKDRNELKYFMTKNAIEYTFIVSDHMNINEGPFTVTSYLGVHYLLKQQIFSLQDMALEEVRKIIEDLADQILLSDVLDEKVAEILLTDESETRIAFDTIVDAKDISILNESKEYTDDEITKVEQKVDEHIVDVNNPHAVTAEQVDTYTKVVIDNKDTAIMNKANSLEDANMFKDVSYNNVNGVLTFTRYDDTTKEIDLPLELLVESGYYDEAANELVLVLANGSEIRIPVGNLLTDLDAHNIRFNGSGTNYLESETEVESAMHILDEETHKTRLEALKYFNYAGSIYGAKYSLLSSAWEHSLAVDPLEISENSSASGPYRGTIQYPNRETEGIIIPHGITSIGFYAFRDNPNNNQPLVIPNSVTSIGHQTFDGWSSNNYPLVIPSSVTSIGPYAFRGWSANTHPLIIPDSITSIGSHAFNGWINVPYIEIKAITPPSLGSVIAFGNTNDAPFYVPDTSVQAYKTATNWSAFASRIFGISKKDKNAITSVNGKQGVVVLTQDDIADGSTYKRVTETEKTTWNNKVTSNTAITGATKTKITYDSKGLVTGGADLVESDIPALLPTKITQNSTNRFVTDTQISTWNDKQDKLVAGDNINIVGNTISADYDDSKITAYVLTVNAPFADGLNQLNNVDLQNVSDIFHPEDIITISNIKIGHNIRLCINRPGGGYTEYGVATIIGLNEDETAIEVIVKKFSGSILNAQSQFLAIGTIIQHPDYPNNIYVNTMAGHFSLSNFEAALTANVIRPLLIDDPNAMAYFNYAGSIYGAKYNLLSSAWNHSLTVDPLEISENSLASGPYRGTAQYPNHETEGIIIPHGVTTIGNYAFRDSNNNQPLIIPNSVTNIGNNAFRNWSSNNQPLIIPDSVVNIGNNAFYDWTSNNQPLVIPDSVTSIGTYAFFNWSSNNQPLIIPDSVVNIEHSAFNNWILVPYIEMKGTTPPILANANAFNSQNNAPIYVPDESVTAYKTATNWSALADRIFAISDLNNSYSKDEIDNMIGDIETLLGGI